jgi:hypothetical protein
LVITEYPRLINLYKIEVYSGSELQEHNIVTPFVSSKNLVRKNGIVHAWKRNSYVREEI